VRRKHHELLAWQEAIALVKEVYRATADFPREETYGLTSQIRRAAVSVPSNIAEGAARTGDREFPQFLSVTRGSLSELETQVIIANELGYLPQHHQLMAKIDKIFGLVGGLMMSLRKRKAK
jgi:four helix bundle protein